MPSYLVTGAGRGLGLAFVEALLGDPQNIVIATTRSPHGSEGLSALQRKSQKGILKVITLDVVGDTNHISQAVEKASALLPHGLDCLISNVGVNLQAFKTADDCDLDVLEEELRVNTISPIRISRAFLPLIRKGAEKKIIFLTSSMGSLTFAPAVYPLCTTYAMTKVALNMLVRHWGTSLRAEGITMLLLHPGLASTDMGNEVESGLIELVPSMELITPQESAERCIQVIKNAKLDEAVRFCNESGDIVPW